MKIALVDDKSLGINQIKNALPSAQNTTVAWFSSAAEFVQKKESFDIVFLDFYLEEDRTTGDRVLGDIRPFAKVLIGFSSSGFGNRKMLTKGADTAFLKLWSHKNEALENYFLEVFE